MSRFALLGWLVLIITVAGGYGAAVQDLTNPTSSCCNDNEGVDTKGPVVCDEMGYYCFDVLNSYLNKIDPPMKPCFTNDKYPLFITWKKGREKALRGCIGTFTPMNLHYGLKEYSIQSATKDPRFSPITKNEFDQLEVEISLLRHFEDAKDYMDWELGTHGILIEFKTEKGAKSMATFLPDVPPEQGWNKIETIDQLLRKGDFKGPIDEKVRKSIRLTRYQSEIQNLSYSEYETHLKDLKNQLSSSRYDKILIEENFVKYDNGI